MVGKLFNSHQKCKLISKTYLSAAIAKAVFSPELAGEVELEDVTKGLSSLQ
jgi:hypothetical protein